MEANTMNNFYHFNSFQSEKIKSGDFKSQLGNNNLIMATTKNIETPTRSAESSKKYQNM